MIILTNSFSINMLASSTELVVEKINKKVAIELLRSYDVANAIGHPDTDAVVRQTLGIDLEEGERMTVTLKKGDHMVVAQYKGPRLPEGATELPKGAKIELWHVCHRHDRVLLIGNPEAYICDMEFWWERIATNVAIIRDLN